MADAPGGNGTQYPTPNPWAHTAFSQEEDHLALADLLMDRGTTGLRRAGGYVREDYLVQLQGPRGIQTYREMRDTSAVVGACLFAVEFLIRNVAWRLQPADENSHPLIGRRLDGERQ